MVTVRKSKPSKRDPNRPKNKEKYKPKALTRSPEQAKKQQERQQKKKQQKLARRAKTAAKQAIKTGVPATTETATKESTTTGDASTATEEMTTPLLDMYAALELAKDQEAGAVQGSANVANSSKRKLDDEDVSMDNTDEPQAKKAKSNRNGKPLPKDGKTKKERKQEKKEKKEKMKAVKKAKQQASRAAARQAKKQQGKQPSGDGEGDSEMKDTAGTSTNNETSNKQDQANKKNKKVNGAESRPSTQEADGAALGTEEAEGGDGQGSSSRDAKEPNSDPKHRFILFAGNLPFSTTDAQLEEHFAPFHPTAIRHRVHPANGASDKDKAKAGRSKGFAFLEFASWSTMKLCMAKMHHSELKDDQGNTRKINVELTAGGGGKGEQRKNKLKEKNARLEDERKRKAKVREDEKKIKAEMKDAQGNEQQAESNNAMDVHPSRQARIKH